MDGMNEWKTIISEANQAFQHEDFTTAIDLNKRALRHAANIFEDYIELEPDNAIMAILVSYLNQAEAYEITQEYPKACCLYERAYTFVSCLMRDDKTDHEVRNAAIKASSCVLTEWMQFLSRHKHDLNHETLSRYQKIVSLGLQAASAPTYH